MKGMDRPMEHTFTFRKKTELISVVVPVFNGERYIADCLNCLLAQTWAKLEILVVNDGSTDGTERIVKDFAERDERIRLLSLPRNRQPYQARLAGFVEAAGDYVISLDADDRFSEDYLEMLARAAMEADADLAICDNIRLLREDGLSRRLFPSIKGKAYLVPYSGIFEEYLRLYADPLDLGTVIYQMVWNKLCRRDLIDRALPYWKEETREITYGDDTVLTTILLFFAKKAVFTKYGAYFHRKDNASAMRRDFLSNGGKAMMDLLEMSYFLERFFDQVKLSKENRKMFLNMKLRMWASMELAYAIQRNGWQRRQ